MNDLLSGVKTSPWISCDFSIWKSLVEGKTSKVYRKKSFLFRQGDSPEYVFIIHSGRVRVTSYQPDGSEKQLYIAEKGAICGETAYLLNHSHTTSAFAIVETAAYYLSGTELENRMRTDWPLAQLIIQLICQKKNILQEQVLELAFSDSLQRVVRTLLNISDQYGNHHDSGVYIRIKFTHEDIATMINVSRVTTSLVFNKLRESKLITKKNGHYILLDIPALKRIARNI